MKKRLTGLGVLFGLPVGAVALSVSGLPAMASDDAHEHGRAELNMAVEGKELEVEFEIPGVDSVGFEHPAATAEDKAAVRRVSDTLSDPTALMVLPAAAGCEVEDVEVEAEGFTESADHDGHGGFHAHYHFECSAIGKLDSVDVQVFKVFPALEHLDVQVVTGSGQRSMELEAGEASVVSISQ